MHTGDWKIDEDPQIGEGVDEAALRDLGQAGVLAMICDSTNVFTPGEAGSEAGVRLALQDLIAQYDGKSVAVASFASNVARLESVMMAAKACDRSVCLVGRSMLRMVAAAKSVGLLGNAGHLISEDEAQSIPAGHVLYLCTGSQGEPRAALSRIAAGQHRSVKFHKGDVVIFSSKIIPGNEKTIFALQNALANDGIEIITEKSHPIHVSGHPCRDELTRMYSWVRPHIAIPVHGERRHLLEHAKLAKSLGVDKAMAPHNGEMILLASSASNDDSDEKHGQDLGAESYANLSAPKIIDIVSAGRLHQDGYEIVNALDDGLRLRRKMAYAGHIAVSLVIDKKGRLLSGPEPRISGFPEGDDGIIMDHLLDGVALAAETAFDGLSQKARRDEDIIESKLSSQIGRYVKSQTGKRSLVEIIAHKVKT